MNKRKKISIPASWHESYNEEDKKKTLQVIRWINEVIGTEDENSRTQLKLARGSGLNHTTLNSLVNGKYVSPPTKHIDALLEYIARETEREQVTFNTPIVKTSVYRHVKAACVRAHKYRNFAVVAAYVGTGKTTALKHYAQEHSNVYLIEADPDMNASVLLSTMVEATKAMVHTAGRYANGTKAEKTRSIISFFKGTDSLLIIDEAETVTPQTLEYVRRISDKAGIGVVLSGTQKLKPLLRDPQGRFGQISSRVSFWPKIIEGITEGDAVAITQAAMAHDNVALSEEILDAFWQMCDGSARVLANSLIPGVRDYGLKKGMALTPELIFKVGAELLGFKRPKRRA